MHESKIGDRPTAEWLTRAQRRDLAQRAAAVGGFVVLLALGGAVAYLAARAGLVVPGL